MSPFSMLISDIIYALVGSALLEKGLSLFQERSYTPKKVKAFFLMVYGLRFLMGVLIRSTLKFGTHGV